MALPWLRLYGETVDDAKLRLLAFEDRWHYIAILCCKAQGLQDSTKPELLERTIGAKLGLAPRELGEVQRRLIEVDLIDQSWQPTGWDRRQFVSDTSAERTRRYRERLASAFSEEEVKHKTDTDTEGDVTSDVTVTSHASLPLTEWQEWLAHRKRRRWPCDKTTLGKQLKLLSQFDTETQRQMLDNSMQAGWQGLFAPKGNGKPRPTRYEESRKRLQAWNPDAAPTNPLLIGSKQ